MINTDLVHIHLPEASPSWKLLMQAGVGVAGTVGVPLTDFLARELAVPAPILEKVDAILLDGMPVDDLDATVIPDRSRLALAAGLPGIAGLAMKKGSAVRALRGGITHAANTPPHPQPGRITLFLYSLAIGMLAAHFLAGGVLATADQLRRYARFAANDAATCGGRSGSVSDVLACPDLAGVAVFRLSAVIVEKADPTR